MMTMMVVVVMVRQWVQTVVRVGMCAVKREEEEREATVEAMGATVEEGWRVWARGGR